MSLMQSVTAVSSSIIHAAGESPLKRKARHQRVEIVAAQRPLLVFAGNGCRSAPATMAAMAMNSMPVW